MRNKLKLTNYFSTPVTLNIFAWLLFTFLVISLIIPEDAELSTSAGIFIIVGIFSTLPYFITSYWIIPDFLFRKRFFLLILVTILTIIVCALITMLGCKVAADYYMPTLGHIGDIEWLIYYFYIFSWNALLGVFSAAAIRIFFSRRHIETQMVNVSNEKTAAELAFLKGQINPQFLTSVMNILQQNIQQEDLKVINSVSTFQNLLNYQLYECTHDEIAIEKEIVYLESYMQVQSSRMEAGSDVQLISDPLLVQFNIAPLLILPLIENAFKHVSHFNDASRNKILVSLSMPHPDEVMIRVENTYEDTNGAKHLLQSGGIGLANLKRRLELLYTNRHAFETSASGGIFTADLSILINPGQ